MANFFYKVDLAGFDPTAVIETEGLRKQKELSMPPLHKWYVNMLEEDGMEYGQWVAVSSLYEDYCSSRLL